jgi:hypothetical protein
MLTLLATESAMCSLPMTPAMLSGRGTPAPTHDERHHRVLGAYAASKTMSSSRTMVKAGTGALD